MNPDNAPEPRAPRVQHLERSLPPFPLTPYLGRDDERSFQAFMEEFNLLATAMQAGNEELITILPYYLKGDAILAYQQLTPDETASWPACLEALAQKMSAGHREPTCRRKFAQRKAREGESLAAFLKALRDLVHLAYPEAKYDKTAQERAIKDQFLAGLPATIRRTLHLQGVEDKTLPELLTLAQNEKEYEQAEEAEATQASVAQITVQNQSDLARQVDQLTRQIQRLEMQVQCQERQNQSRFPNPWRPQPSNGQNRGPFNQTPRQAFYVPPRNQGYPNQEQFNQPQQPYQPNVDTQQSGFNRRNAGQTRPQNRQQPPRYKINASQYLPFITIVLMMSLPVANSFQLCPKNLATVLVALPTHEECSTTLPEVVHRAEVEVYVPRIQSEMYEAIKCTNRTVTNCKNSAFGIRWKSRSSTLDQPITPEDCAHLAGSYQLTDQGFRQLRPGYYATQLDLPENSPYFGGKCVQASQMIIEVGHVVSDRHGKKIQSDLTDTGGCELAHHACQRPNHTLVWAINRDITWCPHVYAGTYPAYVTSTIVLIDAIQAAFVYAHAEPLLESTCYADGSYKMQNDAVIRIIKIETNGLAELIRSKRTLPTDTQLTELTAVLNTEHGTTPEPAPNQAVYEALEKDYVAKLTTTMSPTVRTNTTNVPTTPRTVQTTTSTRVIPTTVATTTTTRIVATPRVVAPRIQSISTPTSAGTTTTTQRTTAKSIVLTTRLPSSSTSSTKVISSIGTTRSTMSTTTTRPTPRATVRPQTTTVQPRSPKVKSKTSRNDPERSLNSKLQYLAGIVNDQLRHNFNTLWTQICHIHNTQVDILRALIAINPTAGVRSWLRRDNILAEARGDALEISRCIPVEPEYIFWNHTVGDKCYHDLPVQVQNHILYASPEQNELKTSSLEIPCESLPDSQIRYLHGEFVSRLGATQVSKVQRFLTQTVDGANVIFNATSIFQKEWSDLETSVTMTEYARRINRMEEELEVVLNRDDNPEDESELTKFLKAAAEKTVESTKDASNFLEKKWNSLGHWFDRYEKTIHLILFIGILPIVSLVSIVFITFRFCPERPKYVHNINHVEMQRLEPEPLLYHDRYVPKSYAVTSTHVPGKEPVIQLEINGTNVKTLIDTGASITYMKEFTAKKLKLDVKPVDIPAAIAANGGTIPFIGKVQLAVTIANKEYELTVLVTQDHHCPAELLLGSDTFTVFARQGHHLSLNFHQGTIAFGEAIWEINAVSVSPKKNEKLTVLLDDDTIVSSRSDTFQETRVFFVNGKATTNVLSAEQETMQQRTDLKRNARPTPFQTGDLVMRRMDVYNAQDRHKFAYKYDGPYIVIKVQIPHVIIKKPNSRETVRLHAEKVKRYWEKKESVSHPNTPPNVRETGQKTAGEAVIPPRILSEETDSHRSEPDQSQRDHEPVEPNQSIRPVQPVTYPRRRGRPKRQMTEEEFQRRIEMLDKVKQRTEQRANVPIEPVPTGLQRSERLMENMTSCKEGGME